MLKNSSITLVITSYDDSININSLNTKVYMIQIIMDIMIIMKHKFIFLKAKELEKLVIYQVVFII